MHAKMLNKLIVATALAVCSGLYAADAPSSPPAPVKPSAADSKKDQEKFNVQRDAMLAERQALIKQLKSATAEQQKAILEKMKETDAAQRELSKQIREDLRKLRQGQGSPGRG